MSSDKASQTDAERKTIKKRKYSRGGCNECKRRKMKCDENKPYCLKCTNLGKTCVYPDKDKAAPKPRKPREKPLTKEIETNGSTEGVSSISSASVDPTGVTVRPSLVDHANMQGGSPDTANFASLVAAVNGVPIPPSSTGPAGFNPSSMDFTVRHYLPNGSYNNSFVLENHLDPNSFHQHHQITQKEVKIEHKQDESRKVQSPTVRSFSNAISDILTPTDSNEYVLNQADLNEMKSLFDEASLLVHDMNELQSFDILNIDQLENYGRNRAQQNPITSGSPKGLINDGSKSMIPSSLRMEIESPNYGMISNDGSENGGAVQSVSDTFEKHKFHVSEFDKEMSNNFNNGQYAGDFDINSPHVTGHIQDNDTPRNSELIEQIIKQHNLVGPHAAYLRYLNNKGTSDSLFPFASSVENNEVVSILLKYSNNCPYLLSALLAMIATVEYNVTGKVVHGTSAQKYVSVCLKSLSQAFANSSLNKMNQFLNDIERLLLTVILLTSIFASKTYKDEDNILNSWKTHLRGAKDLLVNYSVMAKNQNRLGISGGLALARSWFFAIESLAVVTTRFGGTLHKLRSQQRDDDKESDEDEMQIKNEEEIDGENTFKKANDISITSSDEDVVDKNNRVFVDTGYFDGSHNPEYHDALVSSGLLVQTSTSEFHLFAGFTVDFVYVIQEYASCLEFLKARSAGAEEEYQVSAYRIAKLVSLIHKAHSVIVVPKTSKNFVVPQDSPAHPKYPKIDPDRVELPESAFGKYFDYETEKTTYYSWFDVSQQARCDAIYLRLLLTKGFLSMSKESAISKEIINRILSCLFFVLPKKGINYTSRKSLVLAETENYFISSDLFDFRCYMIQSAFRLVTGLVEDEDSFEKLELFFTGIVKLGNGSATEALNNLRTRRDQIRTRTEAMEAGEPITEEMMVLDITDIVPFS